jgi:hypothetical protein
MTEQKIIVIGSKEHYRADCFNWQDHFPNIEEYDAIILNLQSLGQETFDKIYLKIYGMRESIKNIWETKREVFCIMKYEMIPTPTFDLYRLGKGIVEVNQSIKYNNYSWLPVGINLYSNKRGTYFDTINKRFEKYLNLVKEWNFVFDLTISTDSTLDSLYYLLTSLSPIAINKSKKIIAGSLVRVNINRTPIPEAGAIHLLPPPTDSNLFKAIEELIDMVLGTETKVVLRGERQLRFQTKKSLNTK